MDDMPTPLPARPERFTDRLRAFMRARHLGYGTEKTYCTWILDFIRFHNRQHPQRCDQHAKDGAECGGVSLQTVSADGHR